MLHASLSILLSSSWAFMMNRKTCENHLNPPRTFLSRKFWEPLSLLEFRFNVMGAILLCSEKEWKTKNCPQYQIPGILSGRYALSHPQYSPLFMVMYQCECRHWLIWMLHFADIQIITLGQQHYFNDVSKLEYSQDDAQMCHFTSFGKSICRIKMKK